MAKTFDPSQLSQADQLAFRTWQQSLAQYVAENGGGVPAPVSYALAHPEYLQQHPELRQDVDLVSGSMLPPTTREALKDFHPVWSGGNAGMQKDSGLFNKWETWLQLGLAGAVGGVGAAGALGGAAAPAGAATTGGTTAAGATSAYGPLAGGYGLATTEAAVPASLAAEGGAAAATAAPLKFWDKVFGPTTADKVMKGFELGGGLAGSLIQSNQADKATKAQQEAAAKALELQSNIYQQQRSDLAPYRQAGASSLSALTYGLGLDPSKSADTTTPYFQQQAQQQNAAIPAQRMPTAPPTQAMPRSSLASLATDQGGGFANMVSPDGRPARVPQAQVQAALAAGGRLA